MIDCDFTQMFEHDQFACVKNQANMSMITFLLTHYCLTLTTSAVSPRSFFRLLLLLSVAADSSFSPLTIANVGIVDSVSFSRTPVVIHFVK